MLCLTLLFVLTISGIGLQPAIAENSKTMTKDSKVETSHEFDLPAAAVWNLIAGFNTLPDYHAAVPASRLTHGGAIRHLTISEEAGGGIVVERLVNYDDDAMSFSYKIIELIDSPMPFRNYQAWVKLESTGENSCKLYWNSSFNVEGATKEEAEELARVIYQGCYDGITRVLAAYPLGAFNFDFGRLGEDEASQISALQSIGYTGLVMNLTNKSQLEALHRYQAAIGNDAFEIYAGFVTVLFNKDIDAQNAHIDQVIQSLKKSNAKLWVILRVRGGQEVEREKVVAFLRSAAERTKAAGVELVIYPHDSGSANISHFVESAEEALPYIEEIQSDNIFVSLHLCHEIRAGNGNRLDEVAAKIKPWLRLPSINGADIDAVNEKGGWKRGIQPLVLGDYDSSKLLKALKSIDYNEPVILHTFGLQKAAPDHHHSSFKRFQEMLDKL
jgi:sugar phosphate isomerase/epimerase